MSQIEVPDWVVEIAAKAMADSIGHGMTEKCEKHAHAAITAALGAWVVPLIRAAEDEVERRPLSTHKLRAALTALRQEKPE